MVKFLKKTGLCAMTLFLFACGDSDLLKFDNLEGVKNWEPDYKLQLAYANYDVWKLIERVNNGDSTVIEKDNQIFIRHFRQLGCGRGDKLAGGYKFYHRGAGDFIVAE